MPQQCAIETCKRKSRALCHCCSHNLCLDHLKEHQDSYNSQLNTFVDQINAVGNQLTAINVDEIINNSRPKLDQWRDQSYKIINHFYQEKCEELKQRSYERVEKQRKEIDQMRSKTNDLIREQEATHEDIPLLQSTINDIKRDVNQFEEKGIIVDTHPLIINKDLVYIEEWTSNEIDISTLTSPYQTIDCSEKDEPMIASTNQFLLLKLNETCVY